jgi:hypothetical protein
MNYELVFNQILILFFLLIVGYVCRKLNIITQPLSKGITDFVLKVTLPAMIIESMQMSFSFDSLLKSGKIFIISFFIYLFTFFLALFVPKFLGSKSNEVGVFRFALVFSNTVFMGYPVVRAVFGEEGIFYTAIYNLPFNFLVFTLGIMYLIQKDDEKIKIDKKMILNPGIISVFIGFLIFIFSIKLPYAVSGTLKLLGDVTTPLSMIVIGSLLAKTKLKTIFGNLRVYLITVLRLLVIPFIVWLVMRNFIDDYLLLGIPILISAMPVAANSAILAEEYGGNAELSSQVVFISTLFSVFTIPIIVKLFIA